jgi:hypothetical protein
MLRPVLLLAILAVSIAGVAAGSAPAASDTSTARRPNVNYLFKAEFGLEYEVDWTERSGDQVTDCNSWSIDRGTLTIEAGSTPRRGHLEPMPGRLTVFGRYSRSPRYGGRADGVAVGAAGGTVHRTLVQRAGTNQCGDTPPKTLPVPANDCRGGRGVAFTTPNATIRAEMRDTTLALKEATTNVSPSSLSDSRPLTRVLSVTVAGRVPYQKCKTSAYAPEFPTGVGVVVRPENVAALRSLRPGERHRIERQWAGHCADDLADEIACRFEVTVHVDIRRWKPGQDPYP